MGLFQEGMNGLELLRIAIRQLYCFLCFQSSPLGLSASPGRGDKERLTYITEIDMKCSPSQLINKDITPMPVSQTNHMPDKAFHQPSSELGRKWESGDILPTPIVLAKLVRLLIQISALGLRDHKASFKSATGQQVAVSQN
jgi:hypothetical protein